jgi:hypothetical protein
MIYAIIRINENIIYMRMVLSFIDFLSLPLDIKFGLYKKYL